MPNMTAAEFCDKSEALIRKFKLDWPELVSDCRLERISCVAKRHWQRDVWAKGRWQRDECSHLSTGITACILEHYWQVWLDARKYRIEHLYCGCYVRNNDGRIIAESVGKHPHWQHLRDAMLEAVRAILEDES